MPSTPNRPAYAPRDPALDGLRGIAILLVFLFHYGGGLRAHNPLLRAFGYLTQAGWIGVDIFFALSGFLITDLLLNSLQLDTAPVPKPHALRNFYTRRALRILPLYYAALLACATAALLTGAQLHQLNPLLLQVFFLQNIPPLVNLALQTPPPLPVFHLWSLAVEEQFYLLWPFLLLAARTPRRAFHLSLWIFALTTLARTLLLNPHLIPFGTAQTCATFLPFRAGALTLGAALALHRESRSESTPDGQTSIRSLTFPQKPLLLSSLAALTLLLLAASLNHSFLLNTPTAYTLTLPAADLLAAALVALSLHPNLLRRSLSHPILIFLGRISYGFYVLHILLQPLFDHLGTLLTHTDTGFPYQAARLFTALPITTAAAWLSFAFLERPFLRLKSRFPISTVYSTS